MNIEKREILLLYGTKTFNFVSTNAKLDSVFRVLWEAEGTGIQCSTS